jgi:hypothetical protein
MKNSNPTLFATMSAVVLAAIATAGVARAGTEPVAPDKFTATTTAMSPSGVTLRVDVRAWSDEAARGAVVAALAQESGVHEALASLPTVGYVWQSGSAVGYSVKYAHRASTPQGESVTFVTDKLIGGYEFKPWSVTGESSAPATTRKLDYSVIELYLDASGRGAGTLSLAADVKLDSTGALVSLAPDAPRVLASAKLEPKPYWAKDK